MKTRFSKMILCLAVSSFLVGTTSASAGWPVFDASNYAQNVLEAARALQQINNQIRQLQNEALMLQNMGKNVKSLSISQLSAMLGDLSQVSALINSAKGIAYDVKATQAAFTSSYPQAYSPSVTNAQLASDAHQRWLDTMAAFEDTLTIQAQVAKNVQADSAQLSTLTNASQNAVGNLEVSQASNQLLALSVKQQLQIQNLMAAQNRATSLDQARRAESEEEARVALTKFLGSSSAYK